MSGKVSANVDPVVSNPVNAALEAFKAGKDPETAVYGTTGTINPSSVEASDDSSGSSEDSFFGLAEGESNVQSEESQADSEAKSDVEESTDDVLSQKSEKKVAPQPEIEEIIISDEQGRKKIKVDWNDREKLKKYVQMAAGMRKFQAERDRTAAQLKAQEAKLTELETSWKSIEQAYQQEGLRGLVNLLTNKPDGYEQYMEQEVARRDRIKTASPAELEKMQIEEQLQKERRERERLEKQVNESLKKAEAEREMAQQKALESKLHPAFDKYRFAGKLNNPVVEEQYDRAVWNLTLSRLEELPEDVELTTQLIDKEFRTVASNFRSALQQQAEKKASQVVAQKRVNAQEKVASQAVNGMKSNAAVEAFKGDIRSGNLTNALRAVLGGKVKL